MKVNKSDTDDLHKLPYWVKCVKCQKPPKETDWLIEIIPHSNALIHQTCAAGDGLLAGLNLGLKGD